MAAFISFPLLSLKTKQMNKKAFMVRGLRFRPETVAFGPRIRDFQPWINFLTGYTTDTILDMAFPLPSRIPSWFAGHMASSLRRLPSILQDIDLVIEVRDARLPLTSVNPAFEQALGRAWGYQSVSAGWDRKGKGRETGMGIKEKVVVYTKRDLAERRYEEVRPSDRMIETTGRLTAIAITESLW